MKKFLIITILFMLALTVVASDDLYKLIDKIPIDIATGIEQSKEAKINDFTAVMAPVTPAKLVSPVSAGERVDERFGGLYRHDFAEEPFDGRLSLIMGTPLPTPFTTLLVAFGTIGIILVNKNNKWSKQDTTLR